MSEDWWDSKVWEGEEQWTEQWPEESWKKPSEDPVFFGRAVEEEVPVPKALIGKIIGKRAATILDIREKSGAYKIDAQDQSQDPCMVKVAGTAAAVEKAKQMIFQLLKETERRFQGCDFVEFPRAQIPKGWQLNAAQQQTQTKIDLDLSSGDLCKCYIRGEPKRVESAKAMLLTLAVEMDDEHSEYLDLPKWMSEALLSADACRLRSFQEISNARIDVDKSGATCKVRVSGRQDAVDHAKSLIQAEMEKLNQPRGVKRPSLEPGVAVKLQQLEALKVHLNDEARQGLQVSDPSSAVVLLQALRSVVGRREVVDASAFVCERLAKMARRAPTGIEKWVGGVES